MKLNNECVRDILLSVEEIPLNSYADENSILSFRHLQNYDAETITYAVLKLLEANYLNGTSQYFFSGVAFTVDSLTWEGHKFLDNIRDPKIWKETKRATSKIGSVALDVLSSVASETIIKVVNGQLNL